MSYSGDLRGASVLATVVIVMGWIVVVITIAAIFLTDVISLTFGKSVISILIGTIGALFHYALHGVRKELRLKAAKAIHDNVS